MTERTINILARVERAMASDDERQDKQSSIIEEAYREASPNGQALLDRVFVALCGYSLETILTGNEGDDDEDYLSDGDDETSDTPQQLEAAGWVRFPHRRENAATMAALDWLNAHVGPTWEWLDESDGTTWVRRID